MIYTRYNTCGNVGFNEKHGKDTFVCSVCGCSMDMKDELGIATAYSRDGEIVREPAYCPQCGRAVMNALSGATTRKDVFDAAREMFGEMRSSTPEEQAALEGMLRERSVEMGVTITEPITQELREWADAMLDNDYLNQTEHDAITDIASRIDEKSERLDAQPAAERHSVTGNLSEYKRVCDENEELRNIARGLYNIVAGLEFPMALSEDMACYGAAFHAWLLAISEKMHLLGIEVD